MELATLFHLHASRSGWPKSGNQIRERFNIYLALFPILKCALCAQYISSRTMKAQDLQDLLQAQQTYLIQNLPVLAQHCLLSSVIVTNVKPHYHKSISFTLASILSSLLLLSSACGCYPKYVSWYFHRNYVSLKYPRKRAYIMQSFKSRSFLHTFYILRLLKL
jgi:hypothetical protein